MTSPKSPLLSFVLEEAGGVCRVAEELDITTGAVSQWREEIPIERVRKLSEVTGLPAWVLNPRVAEVFGIHPGGVIQWNRKVPIHRARKLSEITGTPIQVINPEGGGSLVTKEPPEIFEPDVDRSSPESARKHRGRKQVD